jgi:hypothetical protein
MAAFESRELKNVGIPGWKKLFEWFCADYACASES